MMKKMIAYCSGLALCAVLAATTLANAQSVPVDRNAPRKLTDAIMGKRLATDWNTRNASMKDQSVNWFDSNDGYFGTYSIDDKDYMSRYDKRGNYIETMHRTDWNSTVPMDIRTSFNNSQYKSQEVTGFWQASDPMREGYYMELRDDQNKVSRVWADEHGEFSTTPYTGKPNK